MVTFDINGVDFEVARNFEREFFERHNVLRGYLGAMGFDDLFSGNFYVRASEYMPHASRALLPAWMGQRGQMKFAPSRVKEGRAAILHELVHVYEPKQARFLAEGIPVYPEESSGNINVLTTLSSSIQAR